MLSILKTFLGYKKHLFFLGSRETIPSIYNSIINRVLMAETGLYNDSYYIHTVVKLTFFGGDDFTYAESKYNVFGCSEKAVRSGLDPVGGSKPNRHRCILVCSIFCRCELLN